jgi:hypothetical protein
MPSVLPSRVRWGTLLLRCHDGSDLFPLFFPFWRSGRQSQTERVAFALLLLDHDPRRSLASAAGHLRQCAPHHIPSYDVFASGCGGCGERRQELRGDCDTGTGTALLLDVEGVAIAVLRCGTVPSGSRRPSGRSFRLFGRHSFLFPLRVYRAVKFQRLSAEIKWLIIWLISTASSSCLLQFHCFFPAPRKFAKGAPRGVSCDEMRNA